MHRHPNAAIAARVRPSPWRLAGGLGLALGIAMAATWALAASPPTPSDAPATMPPAASGNGVIPAPSVDPGITAKPPAGAASLPTPVIPPPGSPGGDPHVVPK